jgi:malonate decarboxylase alpha subunit
MWFHARMFVDLMPDVARVCAEQADRQGGLYTGRTPRTRRPLSRDGLPRRVVVVQVNEIVDELPRARRPGRCHRHGDRLYQVGSVHARARG